MNDEDRAVLRDAVIREGIALAVMAVVLWYMGPGKLVVSGLVHRARTMTGSRSAWIDSQIAVFRTDISRWEHEQAAQPDR
jgi:hypothetical protein